MNEEVVKNFLLSAFSLIDNEEKRYISEVTIITIKSLLPQENEIGNRINYDRLEKEMELWYYYRQGDNTSLLNSIYLNNADVYWNEFDDSIYIRLTPIVFSNNNWDIIREEILKYILFTTGNISTILEGLMVSKILFLIMNKNEEMVDELKCEIINFSQSEFLEKFSQYFRVPVEKYPKKFSIEFERKRIALINILNGMGSNEFSTLRESLRTAQNNIQANNIQAEYSIFAKALYSIKNPISNKKDIRIYENFCDYLCKLNKGRIEPSLLAIDKYYLPNIFSFKEGEEFYHSLLSKCKVLKKEETKVVLKTKSGIYEFKR